MIHKIPVPGQYKRKDIEYTVDENGCWICVSHPKIKGYPCITITQEGRTYKLLMSRFFWIAIYGLIPDDICVLHKCDNPPCININHFFLGTQTDNMADRQAKNRQAKGEKIGASKLTEDIVEFIRNNYKTKGLCYTQCQLAHLFNVDQSNISYVIARKTW